ncbi:MAG: DUF4163 domain-containing protein [Fulvivirga sp.]|nr:DUF4163 domain-containing protein [Fulvivirga sp.]
MKSYPIVLLLLLFSCSVNQEEKAEKKEENVAPLSIDQKKRTWQTGTCDSDTSVYCTTVAFDIPRFSGRGDLANKLNDQLQHHLLKSYLKDSSATDYEAYASQFIEDFESIKSRIDEAFGWHNLVNSEVIRHDSKVMVIKTQIETYTGGAHGMEETYYLNFSLPNGEVLQLKDVMKNGFESKLNEITYGMLVKQFDTSPDEFTGDDAYYTSNFGLLEEDLVFYYNIYEVAPFALGSLEISISYDRLTDIMKPAYLPE